MSTSPIKKIGITVVGLLITGCSSVSAARPEPAAAPVTVKVGYFPSVTHALALIGVQNGTFARALAPDKLDASQTFNAGPAATEALLSGAIDVAFIGPSPSINAFTKTTGAVRIISGAASGGAGLVTKPSITRVPQLKGKTLATPQLGNTQDVALRAFLKVYDLNTDLQGGGDVKITPQANAQTVDTFKQGLVDGAWVPEPFESLLVAAGGHVLIDEATLWPGGKWDSTNIVVRTDFQNAHRATVKRFLQGVVDVVDFIQVSPVQAQAAVNSQLQALTGKPLPAAVLAASFGNLTFTYDPVASSLVKQAQDAVAAGVMTAPKLAGIFDLTLLNQVLTSRGKASVSSS